jgi:hypothetical protein
MASDISPKRLAREIRSIYESDRLQAATLIEDYLEKRLNVISGQEQLDRLQAVKSEFVSIEKPGKNFQTGLDPEVMRKLAVLLLGGTFATADLSSEDFLERLAESLNTIFDILNELVGVINKTLLGETMGDETIRQYIGFHLEGDTRAKSLDSYLGQIKNAFLITQKAFKEAGLAIFSEILAEFDPARIEETTARGWRLGPLRKAEGFDLYVDKFQVCQKWLESGRFMEAFLREFERSCQTMSIDI